jgi:flagellar protein FliS
MCYEGAIDNLKIAKVKYREKDYAGKLKAVKKAMSFIDELLCSLNFEKGGLIAGNLSALYEYVNRRIIMADTQRDPEGFDEVIGILTELSSAWAEIIAVKNRKYQPEPAVFYEGKTQQAASGTNHA